MEVTQVIVKPYRDSSESRLRAFVTVEFDRVFVVHDVKVIQGAERTFIAMPSRRLSTRCPTCARPNHLRANYCNQCGRKLALLPPTDGETQNDFFADICHSIDPKYREQLEATVLAAYDARLASGVPPCLNPRLSAITAVTTPQPTT